MRHERIVLDVTRENDGRITGTVGRSEAGAGWLELLALLERTIEGSTDRPS